MNLYYLFCVFVFLWIHVPALGGVPNVPPVLGDDIPLPLQNQVETGYLLWPREHERKCPAKEHV